MKKKKEKKDYSALLNIVFIIIFLCFGVFIYIAGGKKDALTLVKQTEKAYQNKIDNQSKQVTSVPQKEQVQQKQNLQPLNKYKYTYTYTVDIQGFVKHLELELPIPLNENEKQYLSNVQASIKPTRLYSDGVNTIAQYIFDDIGPQKMNIVMQGEATVRTYNIKNAKILNKKLTHEKDLKRYLQPEPLIESDDSYIKSIANKIQGDTQEEILENIYRYIQDNMTYTMMHNIGAKKALQMKKGKCSEYAAIMIALCRAKNIPARMVIGNIAREQFTQHNWVEVYYDKYGWVMYDPTVEPMNINVYKNGKLSRVERKYDTSPELNYITAGRNKLSTYTSSYSISDTKNGYAKVTETVKIEKI